MKTVDHALHRIVAVVDLSGERESASVAEGVLRCEEAVPLEESVRREA